jgi:hypothetical protein
MLRSILVICLLATTPIAVYSASNWPEDRRIDRSVLEERERFFDRLAADQAFRREKLRGEFEGEERPHPIRSQ